MNDLIKKGSITAKNGFENENYVVNKFNNWKNDIEAQNWLKAMNYDIHNIKNVSASKVKGNHKADIQIKVNTEVMSKKILDVQNIQVKLISNPNGFNQIDKRWVNKYVELWKIPDDVSKILKHFTGELKPSITKPADPRRMFMHEFKDYEKKLVIDFLKKNQSLIISDVLKGRGEFAAEWMLVVLKMPEESYCDSVLKPMELCLNLFGNGKIYITDRGNIKIGNITVQRKGGDGGQNTSQMLQFKINPHLLFTTHNH